MGYFFTVQDDRLKYFFAGPGEPDSNKATKLFALIKTNKEEAINYLAAIPPPKQPGPNLDTSEVINQIYLGTFTGSALIPVLSEYQDIFGYCVWICANDQAADRKRADATISDLVFTVQEFKEIVETAMSGHDKLKALMEVKRIFKGLVMAG